MYRIYLKRFDLSITQNGLFAHGGCSVRQGLILRRARNGRVLCTRPFSRAVRKVRDCPRGAADGQTSFTTFETISISYLNFDNST